VIVPKVKLKFRMSSVEMTYKKKTSGLYYNSFAIVIYDRNDTIIIIYNYNDSGQYYKTVSLANLSLKRSINYDYKVCCKLKHTLQS